MTYPELTPTEQKVLEQLLLGKSNKAISEELGVSINTVKTHLKHVFKKTGVKSRIALILSDIDPERNSNPSPRKTINKSQKSVSEVEEDG